MPNMNNATRQVCDVDIRALDTKKPVLFFETANTTTQSITGESVYAMAKGAKRISFSNPMEGTATIEAQVYPFELYSLLSGGSIESDAVYAIRETVKCDSEGTLTLPDGAVAGTIFVYPNNEFGGMEIDGTFTAGIFTSADLTVGESYEVGCIVAKDSDVKRISFNNKNLPKAYYITMNTVEKDENDELTPYKIILYKAQPQRSFELSQSSEGDPAALTMTFDLLEDMDGNFVEMVEIVE